jgi:hypothetical protein
MKKQTEINSPKGTFKTMKEAGEAHGISRQAVFQKINNPRKKDWTRGSDRITDSVIEARRKHKEMQDTVQMVKTGEAALVKDFEDYMITKDGRIYNIKLNNWLTTDTEPTGKGRYKVVSLGATGGRQTIHRLLAKAFIANPDNLPCVLHWDDDPLNNDLGNLRWGTMTENIKDRERNKARRAASIEEATEMLNEF